MANVPARSSKENNARLSNSSRATSMSDASMLKKYDLDNSGTLDIKEIMAMARDMGLQLSEEEILENFNNADADSDSQLTLNEFENMMKKLSINSGKSSQSSIKKPQGSQRSSATLQEASYGDEDSEEPPDQRTSGPSGEEEDSEEEEKRYVELTKGTASAASPATGAARNQASLMSKTSKQQRGSVSSRVESASSSAEAVRPNRSPLSSDRGKPSPASSSKGGTTGSQRDTPSAAVAAGSTSRTGSESQEQREARLEEALVKAMGDCRTRVCIMGSQEYEKGTDTEELVRTAAHMLATRLGRRSKPAFITRGCRGGTDQTFAEGCVKGATVIHLRQDKPSGIKVGKDVFGAGSQQELDSFFGSCADIYILFGGSEDEAAIGSETFFGGATVIPVIRSGGAAKGLYEFPAAALSAPLGVDQKLWSSLSDDTLDPVDIAKALSAIVADCLAVDDQKERSDSLQSGRSSVENADKMIAMLSRQTNPRQSDSGYSGEGNKSAVQAALFQDQEIALWFKIQKVALGQATDIQKKFIDQTVKKYFSELGGVDMEEVDVKFGGEGGRIDVRIPIAEGRVPDSMQEALSGASGSKACDKVLLELQTMPKWIRLKTGGQVNVTSPWASVVRQSDEALLSPTQREAFAAENAVRIDEDAKMYISDFDVGVQEKLEMAWRTMDDDDSGLVDMDEIDVFFSANPSYHQIFIDAGLEMPMNKAEFMKFWKDMKCYLGVADIILSSELARILANLTEAVEAPKGESESWLHKVVEASQFDKLSGKIDTAQELVKMACSDLKSRNEALGTRRRNISKKTGDGGKDEHELIKLHVGGDRNFVVRRGALVHAPSRLSELFDAQWKHLMPKDKDGFVFIDAHPRQMRALLNWCSESKRVSGTKEADDQEVEHPSRALRPEDQWGFSELVEYYQLSTRLGNFENPGHDVGSVGTQDIQSTVLKTREHLQWILDALKVDTMLPQGSDASEFPDKMWPMKPRLDLIHRASRDGLSARAFHRNCDDQGPTLVCAHDGSGYIFGGFTDVSWGSIGKMAKSPQAFTFEFFQGNVEQPVKRRMQERDGGIYCHQSVGPQFGLAPELRINGADVGRKTTATMKRFGSNTPGGDGIRTVVVSDYEVYRVSWERDHIEELDKVAEIFPKSLRDALHAFNEAVVLEDKMRAALDNEESEIIALEESVRQGARQSAFMVSYVQLMDVASPVMELNVRGIRMATLRATLEMAGASPLIKQIEKNHTRKDSKEDNPEIIDGAVFVDEDPVCFELALNYLRLVRMGFRMKRPPVPAAKEQDFRRLSRIMHLDAMWA